MSDTTYNDIIGLRAIRAYRDDQLDPDDMARILEAARWTGSSKNTQNWAFVVVTDPDQKQRLAASGTFTRPITGAPAAIAIVEEAGGYEFDTGRVAQNIMLAADAIGVASCPITLHDESMAAEVLGLPPGARCRYAVALGYPAQEQTRSAYGGRKPLGALVHHNRYGA
jgi:nitroreductase